MELVEVKLHRRYKRYNDVYVFANLLRTTRMCGDTENIICREVMLFFLPALTSRHVLASWGICHGMRTAGRQIPLHVRTPANRLLGVEVRSAQAIMLLTAQIYF